MAKEAWGTKRICQDPSCEAKFYDLLRSPIICPVCGQVFTVESTAAARPGGEIKREKAGPDVEKAAQVDDSDELLEDDESDVGLDDEDVLDDGDDDTVPLEDIANVTTDDET